MRGERSNNGKDTGLFRRAAIKAAGFRLFGDTCVALPPSATVCALVGVAVVTLLAIVLWSVEVPTRIMATGMLMPHGGPLDVVADEPGQVSVVHVRERQSVQAGDVLLEVIPAGKDSNGSLRSAAELQSMRDEYSLLEVVLERKRAVFRERLVGLAADVEAAQRQLELSEHRAAGIAAKIEVLEARVTRMKLLSEAGHIALDTIEREELALLEVRNAGNAIERELSAAQANLAGFGSQKGEAQRELELAVAEHGLRKQGLLREIKRREYLAVQPVIAPRTGTIAWLPMQVGDAVKKSQALARIIADNEVPEAWMYVSSANARRIKEGETVELQLDAWPAAEFGTVTGIVESVSSFVLGPAEMPVPIATNGPVFEVRASLRNIESVEGRLGPGTTFKAQIVSRRHRLYRWLTKRLRDSVNSDHA